MTEAYTERRRVRSLEWEMLKVRADSGAKKRPDERSSGQIALRR
jgi:hypothetical protein